MQVKLKLGWHSTGNGEGSYGLLDAALAAISSGALLAQIQFVVCTREEGEAAGSDNFIKLVKQNNIPLITLSWRRFRQQRKGAPPNEVRAAYENELAQQIGARQTDWAIMAGYMLISQTLHKQRPTLNLHPALPNGPRGAWPDVVNSLIETNAERSGVTLHEVSDEVDAGRVVAYCEYSLRSAELAPLWRDKAGDPDALRKALRAQIVRVERRFLRDALIELARNPHLDNRQIQLSADADGSASRPSLKAV